VIVFRSVRLALIAAVPNLLAPIALLVTMSYLKTPIKPVVAIIFSIALGLAYNNTVFLLTRLKKVQSSFSSAKDVIMRTWYQEGNPCLFSSLSVIGGFAVFLASYFSPNRTFGAYMLWSIAVGIIGDLVVLPALLRMFPWFIFPGDETAAPVVVRARTWPRNAAIAFTLMAGMGPSAAAAAERVVHTPFVISMKKDAFAQLVFDGIVAKSTRGQNSNHLNDIVTSDPMNVRVSGISLDLKYDFSAPSSSQSEWQLASRSIVAELNVASIEAHETATVPCGGGNCVVHVDGSCSNVKLALPEGTASASGKLVLGQKNGAPRMILQNFKAKWAPGSWQVLSMNCTGPQGFDQAVARAAKDQLAKIDPYLNSIATTIQSQLDASMTDVGGQEISAGNPFQKSQTMLMKNFKTKLDGQGNTVVNGDAYFYFNAAQTGCGAEIPAFAAAPAVKAGDTAMIVPYGALRALIACVHADGSFAFDTDSAKFKAFNDFMHSGMEKSAVWPDLNRFDENTLMKFHGATAAAPVLTGEKAVGTHVFTTNLAQKVNVTMLAPQRGHYVNYTNIVADYNGPVRVSVDSGRVSLKPVDGGRLALSGTFAPDYVAQFHPEGGIDWSRITPEAQKALLEQGWSFALPTYGVNPKVLLQMTDGDLQGANFRLGFRVIRK